tara:strand:+ start:269 stop:613 length:345 start_codon:yes stop_codon:yes gene_type:complete
MVVDCLKCINSACCSLVIEVDKLEFELLKEKGLNDCFIKHVDVFVGKFPKFKDKKEQLDENYFDNYAEMKKSKDGLCVNLDRKTMLCSIYEDRPKVCKDYENNRCSKIRKLCTN